MINLLYKYADEKNIEIVECKLPGNKLKGLYCDETIYLNQNIRSEKEKYCLLAEEIGHYETSYGNILDYKDLNNQKQEITARNWAAEKIVTIKDLINAFNSGIKNRYELSEYLNITEEFIDYSIKRLSQKYGEYVVEGDYIVYFEPNLAILKTNER